MFKLINHQKVCHWIVDHCIPKTIVYICALKVFAYGTSGYYKNTIVNNLSVYDAMCRYYGDVIFKKGDDDESVDLDESAEFCELDASDDCLGNSIN